MDAGSSVGWDEILRLGTVGGAVATSTWFLFRQQMSIKETIYKKFEELKNVFSDKLEYHERHDDQRFENISKDLLEIRITQARQGTKSSKYTENGNNGNTIRN